MKKILVMTVAVFLSMSIFSQAADAKRFGGGRSIGKSWSSNRSYSKPSSAAHKPSTSKGISSGAKGAMMGLLAGGLMGSLLFGGGFHGTSIMDMMILAGIAFVVWRILQAKRLAKGGPKVAFASTHSAFSNVEATKPRMQNWLTGSSSSAVPKMPEWFDEASFVRGAKEHFLALQAAWDQNDMMSIRSYCTPELFQQLVEERKNHPERQSTDVVSLNVSVADVTYEDINVIVHLKFEARLREDGYKHLPPQELQEVWSIQHGKDSQEGDWLIAGITQI